MSLLLDTAYELLFRTQNQIYTLNNSASKLIKEGSFSLVLQFSDLEYPSCTGLLLGISCVAVVHVFAIAYHYYQLFYNFDQLIAINAKYNLKESRKNFWGDLVSHLCNPEGFLLIGAYLSFTWMFNIMPESYYSFDGGVNPLQLIFQFLIVDILQTVMHLLEHKLSSFIYQKSHKPHHRIIQPKLFDAFNGSPADTVTMILIPLSVCAQVVHCNVWTYMAFGSLYASWLTLVHCEYSHPWESVFRAFSIGTAGDHHVHHAKFNYNFGHLFMIWDKLIDTYKSPVIIKGFQFAENINNDKSKME